MCPVAFPEGSVVGSTRKYTPLTSSMSDPATKNPSAGSRTYPNDRCRPAPPVRGAMAPGPTSCAVVVCITTQHAMHTATAFPCHLCAMGGKGGTRRGGGGEESTLPGGVRPLSALAGPAQNGMITTPPRSKTTRGSVAGRPAFGVHDVLICDGIGSLVLLRWCAREQRVTPRRQHRRFRRIRLRRRLLQLRLRFR